MNHTHKYLYNTQDVLGMNEFHQGKTISKLWFPLPFLARTEKLERMFPWQEEKAR
jgi:hypothetical protein